MFQLVLPYTRSTTAARGGGRIHKAKMFARRKVIPCVFCHCKLTFDEATVEHIIPISKGGTNHKENLTISCQTCNNNRRSVPFDEWKKVAPFNKLVRLLIKGNKIVGRCLV